MEKAIVKIWQKRTLRMIFLWFLLVPSCAKVVERTEDFLTPGSGQLTIYLNGPEKSVLRLGFVLNEIQVQDATGTWVVISAEPMRIDSPALVGSQFRLAERWIPRGQYRKIKLVIRDAAVIRERERASLLIPDQEVFVDFEFKIFGEENTTLFLDWDVDRSMPREHLFVPAFAARLEGRELPILKIYVTNEGSNNVSIINRRVDRVVSVVAVGNQPRGIAASPDGKFVFVANSGSDNISVIDTSTNRVVQTINLSFGDEPVDLAIDPRGKNLFVTNYRTNSLSIIDAFSFQEIARVEVGKGPVAIGIDDRRRKAFIANSLSNDVTVLDTFSRRVLATVKAESQPFDVASDPRARTVYIVNRGSNNITVIDSATNQVAGRVSVGPDATAVAVDPGRDRIFVSKGLENRVLFLRPSLNSVTNTVAIEGSPGRGVLDTEKRKLFVVSRSSNTLTVIDKFTARKQVTIPVGFKPFDVTSTD